MIAFLVGALLGLIVGGGWVYWRVRSRILFTVVGMTPREYERQAAALAGYMAKVSPRTRRASS